MPRLRWQAINGVRGVRGTIQVATNLGTIPIARAVQYGQWAIHETSHSVIITLRVSHVPSGRYLPCDEGHTEEQLRDLIRRLLVVPEFKTWRAQKAIQQVRRIIRAWATEMPEATG